MVEELETGGLCPYAPKICEFVGSYRCTKACEDHPESYLHSEEVRKKFDEEPWVVYCFTCAEFLVSRGGHPKEHKMATGVLQYKEFLTEFVMERMTQSERLINEHYYTSPRFKNR